MFPVLIFNFVENIIPFVLYKYFRIRYVMYDALEYFKHYETLSFCVHTMSGIFQQS